MFIAWRNIGYGRLEAFVATESCEPVFCLFRSTGGGLDRYNGPLRGYGTFAEAILL